jgi:Grx4 family monothiol glutaredoxin
MSSAVVQEFTDDHPIPSQVKAVILFGAEWHEACASGSGILDQALTALAQSSTSSTTNNNNTIIFGKVDAEGNPSLTANYDIKSIPTFVFLNEEGVVVERIVGGAEDVARITNAVQKLRLAEKNESTPTTSSAAGGTAASQPSQETSLSKRLDTLIRMGEVMVFMKGTPTQPRCGFSRQVVEIFQAERIPFAYFDILTDETVRQGLKQHSQWPTYPQIYVHGELVGGLDILKELQQQVSSAPNQRTLAEEWKLTTIPHVQNTTSSITTTTTTPLEERIRTILNRNRVVLFMKGLPSAPRCGFSKQMVEILDGIRLDTADGQNNNGVAYDAIDILTDEELRQGLKTYSNWPTYPQLYVDGELIGGLDIVREMAQDGSLQAALSAATTTSTTETSS